MSQILSLYLIRSGHNEVKGQIIERRFYVQVQWMLINRTNLLKCLSYTLTSYLFRSLKLKSCLEVYVIIIFEPLFGPDATYLTVSISAKTIIMGNVRTNRKRIENNIAFELCSCNLVVIFLDFSWSVLTSADQVWPDTCKANNMRKCIFKQNAGLPSSVTNEIENVR